MSHNRNSDRPLVSAIVPACNAARYIGHTLRSLVTQTYPNLEIIVVDDGSCDATVPLVQEMARRHPQIRVIQQRNSGVAAARNSGIEISRGIFIAPVDADDIWFPEAAERLADCLLQSDQGVGVAYGWSVTIDEVGLLDGGFRCSMIEGDVFYTLLCHNFLGNASSTMIRRTCLERYGGYDGQFRAQGAEGCEDWELYLRLAEHCQFCVVPEFLIGYRRPRGSMSSDVSSIARSHAYLLQKIGQRHPEIPKVMYRLSSSSLYLYLAQECHRQRLPHQSYRWMRQALAQLHLLNLLRPGWYALAAKNAWAIFQQRWDRLTRSANSVPRRTPRGMRRNRPVTRVEDVARRRARIRVRILAQEILHSAISRLHIT